LIVVALCVTLSDVGVCQAQPTWAELRPDTKLRLQLLDSTRVAGRFLGSEQGYVRVRTTVRTSVREGWVRDQDRQILLDSLAAAWIKSGTRWKLGAVLGAPVGAVGTVIAGVITLESQDGSSCDAWCWTSAVAVGTLGGALLGAIAGHLVPVWKPVSL
jgi:hypothetical protein